MKCNYYHRDANTNPNPTMQQFGLPDHNANGRSNRTGQHIESDRKLVSIVLEYEAHACIG